jgi:hypothetical protein
MSGSFSAAGRGDMHSAAGDGKYITNSSDRLGRCSSVASGLLSDAFIRDGVWTNALS